MYKRQSQKRVTEKDNWNYWKNWNQFQLEILWNVQKISHGPLDSWNLIGKILNVKNDLYQIWTKSGIIKKWFARCDFQISGAKILDDIPEIYIYIFFHEVVANELKFGGQGHSSLLCYSVKQKNESVTKLTVLIKVSQEFTLWKHIKKLVCKIWACLLYTSRCV